MMRKAKKSIILLLALALAFSLAVGILAGCGGGKGDYEVSISPKSATIDTGTTRQLTARVASGETVEFEWSSDNESVATVDDFGVVYGVKKGEANITATVKGSKSKATCKVTVKDAIVVTFKANGQTTTLVTLDKADETKQEVQLSATASDGSNITSWFSANESVATVSNSGLVKIGTREGTTTITARTSTGGTGTITVTTIDSVEGEHYDLDTTPREGWYYTKREDGGRSATIVANYRLGTVSFDVTGDWNWSADSIYLVKKDSAVSVGWHELTMDIKSSIETYITINSTRVYLEAGDNHISVAYEQKAGQPAINITFNNGAMGTAPNTIKVEISNEVVTDWTETPLVLPEFDISGDTVTFTDDKNSKFGVDYYEVGLFDDGGNLAFSQIFYTDTDLVKSGALDTSGMDESANNQTYTVKVRAIGYPGYTSTNWTTETKSYTVTNADQPYELTQGSDPQKKGGGFAAALTSGRWEYTITDIAEGAYFTSASYANGVVTWTGNKGWASDSFQMFRHYGKFEIGTELTVTMKINLSAAQGGKVIVCGQETMLNVGDNNITVDVTQVSGKPTIEIIFGTADPNNTEWPGKAMANDSLPYGDLTVKISNVSVTEKA